MSTRPRVRAPELRGRGWLNTGGDDLPLADLRGRFVLLDFWAFCCVNCLHVLDELRPLEEKYAGELVVVGVHSPKFVHEADPDALARGGRALRGRAPGARRPGAGRPGRPTPPGPGRRWCWSTRRGTSSRSTPARATPTPSTRCVAELREEHRAKGTLQPGDSPYVAPAPPSRRPARSRRRRSRLPGGGLPGRRRRPPQPGRARRRRRDRRAPDRLRRARAGRRRRRRGRFNEPNGLCLLPDEVRRRGRLRRRGRRHRQPRAARRPARRRRRSRRSPATAGSGCRATAPAAALEPVGRGLVAGPGRGSRWPASTSCGPSTRAPARVEVAAGTTNEGLLDGPLRRRVVRADLRPRRRPATGCGSRTARPRALRYVEDGAVHTAVGTGLFDFGFRDGPADEALLQHPLGVTVLPDGSVAVCDTYNGAVRRFDPDGARDARSRPAWPSRAARSSTATTCVVVESAAHRLTRVPLAGVATARRVRAHAPSGRSPRSPPGDARARRGLHAAARARRSTTGSGRRRSWSSPRRPPALLTRGRGPRHRPDPHGDARPARRRRRAARRGAGGVLRRATAARARPATCTSRTGACRSGSSPAATRAWCCRCPPGEPSCQAGERR